MIVGPLDVAPLSPGSEVETAPVVNGVTANTSDTNNGDSYNDHIPGSDNLPLVLTSSTEGSHWLLTAALTHDPG